MSIFLAVSGTIPDGTFSLFGFIFHIDRYITEDTKLVLYGFIMVYGIRMFMDFIATGEYRRTSINYLMFQPYLRIFIQQFVVILGAMFLEFGAGKLFMLVFVFIKIGFELFINFDRLMKKKEQVVVKNSRQNIRPL